VLSRTKIREQLETKGTYSRWVLIAALAGMFATSFPVTILSVSLSDIAKEFNTSTSTLTWVISGPMLLSALTLPILGKLGDLYGHRRVFLTGFTLATVVSVLTALSWDPLSLIGFRSLSQMIGGATQPTSMAIVMLVFAPHERVKALGYWTFVSAGAPAIGLAVGGPLIDLFGWRLIFVIQAVLAAGALAFATLILPESNPTKVKFDLPGALSLSVVVGALMLIITEGPGWGFGHILLWASIIAFPVATWIFIWVERRASAPLIPLGFLKDRDFTFNLLVSMFMGAVYMGGFVLSPVALRDGFGLSATTTATVMLLRTGFYSVSSPLGGQLGARLGNRRTIIWGNISLAVSMAVFIAGTHYNMLLVFCFALMAQGIGNGIARPPATAALANTVPESDLGLAAALQRMTQQIGNSFGIAVMSAFYNNAGTTGSFTPPFVAGVVMALIAIATSLPLRHDAPNTLRAERLSKHREARTAH